MLCINYDTVLRSMEETIIFNVGSSDKAENICSIICVLFLQRITVHLQVTLFCHMTLCIVIESTCLPYCITSCPRRQ